MHEGWLLRTHRSVCVLGVKGLLFIAAFLSSVLRKWLQYVEYRLLSAGVQKNSPSGCHVKVKK